MTLSLLLNVDGRKMLLNLDQVQPLEGTQAATVASVHLGPRGEYVYLPGRKKARPGARYSSATRPGRPSIHPGVTPQVVLRTTNIWAKTTTTRVATSLTSGSSGMHGRYKDGQMNNSALFMAKATAEYGKGVGNQVVKVWDSEIASSDSKTGVRSKVRIPFPLDAILWRLSCYTSISLDQMRHVSSRTSVRLLIVSETLLDPVRDHNMTGARNLLKTVVFVSFIYKKRLDSTVRILDLVLTPLL
ncbi:hypothetical protein V8F06_006222 [Rhypophila decipiens]